MKNAFLAIIAALLIGFGFCSCNKEKANEPASKEPGKAIAKSVNGQMTYLVSVEEMQKKVEAHTANTKDAGVYIIEDWYIDEGDGTDLNPLTLAVSIANVAEENVTTHFFMKECLVKSVENGVTTYYINPELLTGNYEMTSCTKDSKKDGKGTSFTVSNGEVINIDPNEPLVGSNKPHPYWHVDCTTDHCSSVCQRDGWMEGGVAVYGCKECRRPQGGYEDQAQCIAHEIMWWERVLGWFHISGFSIF